MEAKGKSLNNQDRELIRAAEDALRRGFDRKHHDVAAAVRTRTGAVFLGLDIIGLHTPCAEPVALGAAITAGDREFEEMVAVCKSDRRYVVLSPCGTCRQMLFDYAPKASVIVRFRNGRVARLTVSESLPGA